MLLGVENGRTDLFVFFAAKSEAEQEDRLDVRCCESILQVVDPHPQGECGRWKPLTFHVSSVLFAMIADKGNCCAAGVKVKV